MLLCAGGLTSTNHLLSLGLGCGEPAVEQRLGRAGVDGLLRNRIGRLETLDEIILRHQMPVGHDGRRGVEQRR